MRRRVSGVVAATTSAVVLVFVIPLCLLVQSLAEDRGLADADQEARNIAILVSGLHDSPQLPDLVAAVDQRSPARTSVLTAGGQVLGTPADDLDDDPAVLRALAGRAFTEVTADGALIVVPVVTPEGTDVVRTSVTNETLRAGVTRAWLAIGLLGLLLLVAAVVIADRLGKRISTPVTDLAAVAHRLREGELDARARPAGPPETTELGHALNRLAERITELLMAERAAVGDLSHRLRTPVTALRLDVEGLEDPALSERLQEHVSHLQRTVDAIVKEARRPVRDDMASACDAVAVTRERVRFWSALAEDQGRSMEVTLPSAPEVVAAGADDLRDILDVVVDNVFAHTPEGTAFSVSLVPESDHLVLVVSDDGPGLPHRSEARRSEPGFSGLGLQIVRRTVHGFGGELWVESGADRGTLVRVHLPRGPQGAPTPRTPDQG